MIGTVVNSIAIIIGGLLGLILRKGIREDSRDTLMDGIGLSVMIIGITSGIQSENVLLLVVSIVLGSIIGEIIEIEDRLDFLGNDLQNRIGKSDSQFSESFVTASLIFCIGAMAVVGSIEAGIHGDHTTLYVKSILDGITSLLLSSTLGVGVLFAAIPVFIYQGIITLLANSAVNLLTPEVITEMSAVGGTLILAIGVNLLGLKKIRIGNMLPGIIIPIIYYFVVNLTIFA